LGINSKEKMRANHKSYGKKVMYHSDGAVRPLIPDLIEMVVDVLNLIQPGVTGMEADGLKKDFGERLCFHGGVDIGGLLPEGKPDEVREAVKNLVGVLGASSGGRARTTTIPTRRLPTSWRSMKQTSGKIRAGPVTPGRPMPEYRKELRNEPELLHLFLTRPAKVEAIFGGDPLETSRRQSMTSASSGNSE
jgi:hypothetical protein